MCAAEHMVLLITAAVGCVAEHMLLLVTATVGCAAEHMLLLVTATVGCAAEHMLLLITATVGCAAEHMLLLITATVGCAAKHMLLLVTATRMYECFRLNKYSATRTLMPIMKKAKCIEFEATVTQESKCWLLATVVSCCAALLPLLFNSPLSNAIKQGG
jgi:hypothetical protein